MPSSPIRYLTEQMSDDELLFIREKLAKDRKSFYKVVRYAYIWSVIIPLIIFVFISLFVLYAPKEPTHKQLKPVTIDDVVQMIGLGTISLWIIVGVALWLAYRFNIHPLALDVKDGHKIIEIATITQKKYMPHNDTYHFYLRNSTKVSVEISEDMYQELQVGDECNLEYTAHARIDLGSF